jgi:hypothetical protein
MKARIGSKNGRWKGIPDQAKHYFLSGYLSGLSIVTLSKRWKMMHSEAIDCRRIERWLISEGVKLHKDAKQK